MGVVEHLGENRAEDAAKQTIQYPLLKTTIERTKRQSSSITGEWKLGLHEVNTAAELVQGIVDQKQILFSVQ